MDFEPGKPDAEGEGDSEGLGAELEDGDTKKRSENTDDAGEPLPKTVTGANAILSSKNNTHDWKELNFQEQLPKIENHFSSQDTTTDESMTKRKNPMLLGPIIRCIFKFLDIKDVKKFSFVSREWSSAGKQALTSRALIRFQNCTPGRLPSDFYSCFLNSAARFSSFAFYGRYECSWTVEELSKFFDKQQKSIKELDFRVCKFMKDKTIVKNFDISPWISKSPMVKDDAKYLTKLSICNVDCAIPLKLLKHIKHLFLSKCRVNLEAGIQIHPVKLSLAGIDFYQDETLLSIQLNDIINFSSTKEISLDGHISQSDCTILTIDLSGNCSLERLTLLQVGTVNWETSNWNIRHMQLEGVDFPTSQMTINELYLCSGEFNLFGFPQSIEKLGIDEETGENITCSEPTTLENLKYLSVTVDTKADLSFLAHFMNCPQLAHLKIWRFLLRFAEIKLPVVPKAVKTLTLNGCSIDWLIGSYCYANIEKLVVFETEINFERISKAKVSVDDIIFICGDYEQKVPKSVVNFFNCQNPWSLCKRFYIGKLKWEEMKLEDSVLNEHVDVKSEFYVFENGEQGRALDEISFHQLADIPKHINF